jgi:hypothetical protein
MRFSDLTLNESKRTVLFVWFFEGGFQVDAFSVVLGSEKRGRQIGMICKYRTEQQIEYRMDVEI